MKFAHWIVIVMLIFSVSLLVACGQQEPVEPGAAGETPTEAAEVPEETPAAVEETPAAEETPAGEDVSGDVVDQASFVAALEAQGATVGDGGEMTEPLFDTQGSMLEVNGQTVQVFEFESEAAAAEAAATVSAGGTIIGTITIDWVDAPHFYQKGRLIVLYVGSDEATLTMLKSILGAPFVEGQGMGQGGTETEGTPDADTVSHGGGVVDYVSLVDALRGAGATVEVGETVTQPFFTPEGQLVKVNGEDVQVFEFADEAAMEEAAAEVSPDGSSVGTSMVSWMGIPHFYKQGQIIVIYVGSNAEILDLLQSTVGAQFAGG